MTALDPGSCIGIDGLTLVVPEVVAAAAVN